MFICHMRYKEIDKNVFGSSQCAIDLVTILNELNQSKVTRKVGRTIVYYKTAMKDLKNTKLVTEHFYRIYLEYTMDKIKLLELPVDVKSRLLNLIKGEYRTYLAELDVNSDNNRKIRGQRADTTIT